MTKRPSPTGEYQKKSAGQGLLSRIKRIRKRPSEGKVYDRKHGYGA